jgi:hypothetical protein
MRKANSVNNQGEAMKSIHVVTEVAAPVEIVWAQLSAISEYPEWNSFITLFRGDLVVGRQVEVRIAPPGGRAMTFRPTVTVVEQGECLEWLGHLGFPGVFDARHSFRLDAREGNRTRLTQAEEFSGFLLPLMGTVLDRTRAGFEAMNEALRVRAESAAATEGVL